MASFLLWHKRYIFLPYLVFHLPIMFIKKTSDASSICLLSLSLSHSIQSLAAASTMLYFIFSAVAYCTLKQNPKHFWLESLTACLLNCLHGAYIPNNLLFCLSFAIKPWWPFEKWEMLCYSRPYGGHRYTENGTRNMQTDRSERDGKREREHTKSEKCTHILALCFWRYYTNENIFYSYPWTIYYLFIFPFYTIKHEGYSRILFVLKNLFAHIHIIRTRNGRSVHSFMYMCVGVGCGCSAMVWGRAWCPRTAPHTYAMYFRCRKCSC